MARIMQFSIAARTPTAALAVGRDEDHLFITDPQLIGQILEHLGLWVQKSSRDPRSQEASHGDGEIVYEPFDDGWPGYEEPSIMLN